MNPEDDKFDMIVGKLEETLMGALPAPPVPPQWFACPGVLRVFAHTALLDAHTLRRADDEFQKLTHGFMAKHCEHFEDTPENKLVYTSIFSQYVSEPPHPFLLVRFSCAELPSSLSLPSELSDGAH